ncbi:MAG: DUF4349 domain-containing protein [Myxococcota bacterium]
MRLFLCLLIVACGAKRHEAGYAPAADYEESYGDYGGGAPPAAKAPSMAAPAAPPPPPSESAPAKEEATPEPAEARMVHYEGWATLRVAHREETSDAVQKVATDAGGYLERMGDGYVIVRVPVAKFDAAFAAVLALGEVVQKRIAAEDVTEAFTDSKLRLDSAKATRDRLVALLAKAKTDEEKLRLIREIKEVTEQIDQLEAAVRLLRELADFSRISVQLEERPALSWQGDDTDPAALAWIRALSPFNRTVYDRPLKLDVPAGLVKLDEKKSFVTESPDGTRFWATRTDNEPVGTAAFWMDAIAARLSPEFASAERGEHGGWTTLRLVDRGDPAYAWWIAVRVDGEHLDLAQAYFPTLEQETRYRDAVRAALAGGGA